LLNLKKTDDYPAKHMPLWLVILSCICALGMFSASIFVAVINHYEFWSWNGVIDFGITILFGWATFWGLLQLVWRIQDR